MSPNMRAALLMMASMAGFTLNDTCIKLAGADLPLFQLIALRGVLASAMIGLLAWRLNALKFRIPRGDWALVAVRSGAEIAATYFFLTALMYLPLANLTAVMQALPLTVTLGAALLFGERVGWHRALAIAAGFAGMLLIVRPGPEGFSLYAVYALAAVAAVTLRDLVTRRMSSEVPSMTVTLVASVTVMLFGFAASAGSPWQPLTWTLTGVLIASALFIFAGYLFSVLVMRVGEISFTAPFRYTGLIWALALGWLVWGDWPDALTLLGAAIVVASGLYALYREGRKTRRT